MDIDNYHRSPPPPYEEVVQVDTQYPPPHPHPPGFYVACQSTRTFSKLRLPAYALAGISCCTGLWFLSIPAIILAVSPEACGKMAQSRRFYTTSMVFSLLAIAVGFIFTIVVITVGHINSSNRLAMTFNNKTGRHLE